MLLEKYKADNPFRHVSFLVSANLQGTTAHLSGIYWDYLRSRIVSTRKRFSDLFEKVISRSGFF